MIAFKLENTKILVSFWRNFMKSWKNSWNFVNIQNSSIWQDFFIIKKIRQTLFTFNLSFCYVTLMNFCLHTLPTQSTELFFLFDEIFTWCARQMRSKSCRFRNFETTSAPNVKETPRSFSPQPCTSLSGSDQRRSHKRPEIQKQNVVT